MKLIPWTPPNLMPELGAVLVPQQWAPAVTWANYQSLLAVQVERMFNREGRHLEAVLRDFQLWEELEPIDPLIRSNHLLQMELVSMPVSRALHLRWPLAAHPTPRAEKVLLSGRGLRRFLELCEEINQQTRS